MAIRTKIAAAMAVLLIVAVSIIGFVTVQTVSTQLVDQLDQKLHGVLEQGGIRAAPSNVTGEGSPTTSSPSWSSTTPATSSAA